MSSHPSAIEATKFFDWVLKHPGREACFGSASDLDIVMHCDKMLRSENHELFILEKTSDEPLIALWCEVDKDRRNFYIHNILGVLSSNLRSDAGELRSELFIKLCIEGLFFWRDLRPKILHRRLILLRGVRARRMCSTRFRISLNHEHV